MGRLNVAQGQEILRADINKISPYLENELYERTISELLGNTSDGFFGTGFKVTYVGGTTVAVAAGNGFQTDSSQTYPETKKRPLHRASAGNKTLTTPHATLGRVDIVCVKAARADGATESRRYKPTIDTLPSLQDFVTSNDWEADVVVTAGTPDALPVAPSTPAGYIKIATLAVAAVTGLAGSGSVTDNRTTLSYQDYTQIDTTAFLAVATKASGTILKTVLSQLDSILGRAAYAFDAVVGSGSGCTHATLAAALADAAVVAGSRILVTSSATIATMVTVSKANMLIEFSPGVTYTAGAATKAITLGAAGNRIRGGRFSGFATAIEISNTFNNQFVTECRFASCTTDVDDLNTTPNNVIVNNITE